MGNREDLLEGAKRCLVERGWANTTVRDIAAAAGVSHAAIGYHFGSRERLLVQALLEELDELDSRMAPDGQPATAVDRWQAVLESFSTDKALWTSHLEAIVQAQRNDELRARLAEGQQRARAEMGGSVALAVVLGMMVQSLIDPDSTPTAAEAVAELRELAGPSARAAASVERVAKHT
ncbi:TetR family transcriptional regulator [Mycolicibacter minnesotensis]|uniref:TetR family transcriptional regulator n=1 Tax=Mycolicibacter minnesotensis TaxID=1118379 RepID=A0A7I7R7Z8_9MYCO|nr:TetR family transcriptional regulator [Mycolicibacter minnesotensis]ORA97550.1 TetR family transcriptional regulator [Mycolicibacter minnesotensis]BBY34808.1 TetR family transcriptional regulator [Mycolicibacter minnesotensis]